MEVKVCEFCGEMFEPKTVRSRHCSVSCKGKDYYRTHPEYRKSQIKNSAKRIAENPDARAVAKIARDRWRKANPEKARAATKRWEEANKEHVTEKHREWFAAHPEKRKEYHDKWKGEHPERIRSFWKDNTYRRRALKAAADGDFTYAEFLSLCQEKEWECAYCGCELDVETVTADHEMPLSRGGSNDIGNIAPCCVRCNCRKKDKTPEEYSNWLNDRVVVSN